jgi:large subunit ribosomal protein L25
MEKIKLNVTPREHKTPNQIRREGLIPATLYGPGQPSESIQVNARDFSRLPNLAYSHMIELDLGEKSPVNVIIRNVQRKSTNHSVLNIEFYRVRLDRKLTVTVPLNFTGVSAAVVGGGQLVEIFQEADIECLPGDIPDYVEVDLSKLAEIEDALHFSDLPISDKVKILNPPDEVVVKVVAPRIVEEEEKPAAAPVEGEAPAEEPAAPAAPA